MPAFSDRRFLPFTPEQVYDVIADVENYPKFLPWCLACRIVRRYQDGFEADLSVGFKLIRETYRSRVVLSAPNMVDVKHIKGPFKHLETLWEIQPTEGGSDVVFHIDFEFRSALLSKVMGGLFQEAAKKMASAFEARVRDLHSA